MRKLVASLFIAAALALAAGTFVNPHAYAQGCACGPGAGGSGGVGPKGGAYAAGGGSPGVQYPGPQPATGPTGGYLGSGPFGSQQNCNCTDD